MITVVNMAPASIAHLFTLTQEELSLFCHRHKTQAISTRYKFKIYSELIGFLERTDLAVPVNVPEKLVIVILKHCLQFI